MNKHKQTNKQTKMWKTNKTEWSSGKIHSFVTINKQTNIDIGKTNYLFIVDVPMLLLLWNKKLFI